MMILRIVLVLLFVCSYAYGQDSLSGSSPGRYFQVLYEVENAFLKEDSVSFEGVLWLSNGHDTLFYQEIIRQGNKEGVFYHIEKYGEAVKEYKLSLGKKAFMNRKEKKKQRKRKKKQAAAKAEEETTLDSLSLVEAASDLRLEWGKSKGESRRINGYLCYKDTARLEGRAFYEVWYCPDLPAGGPWILWHPEGLVLEARTLDGNLTFRAKTMQYTNELQLLSIDSWVKVWPMNRSEYIEWGKEFGDYVKESLLMQIKPYLKFMSMESIQGLRGQMSTMNSLLRDPGIELLFDKAMNDAVDEMLKLKLKEQSDKKEK
ncbi:hypothetical protein [Thermonema rossianum]|uniref:hypothetical protein n=1 Tax=Thermonema rossianum TaxID=55505 RepID=UPI0012FA539B|nr:hypothetical protein [Thermonema rossianum]